MMSKKQWFVLLCLFIIYLLLGASIFYHIESAEETRRLNEDKKERIAIEALLKNHYSGNYVIKEEIFGRLSDYCGKPIKADQEEPRKWDFYHALFFVITVVSTIGYGNLAPTTMFTRLFMIFYGLIGIPLNGIVMVTLGEHFGKSFTKLYDRWKTAKIQYTTAKLGLISQIFLYLIPGFTFFIFLPSVFMTIFEDWQYDVAVYYAFVTLTTIGFGDYVAGVNNVNEFSELSYTVYKIFLLIWVIGGLGYVVMVLGFITRGLRSRHVANLEHIIAENIKRTPQRIRHELRELLQEFLFQRIKPVYKDFDYLPKQLNRSQSCPNLTMYRNEDSPTMCRKRAFSECPRKLALERVQSDSQLEKIDKVRTFTPSHAFMQQKDLLLKVVDALSTPIALDKNIEIRGVNCFSDEEILASEKYQDEQSELTRRNTIMNTSIRYNKFNDDHTWYGNQAAKQIEEFNIKRRRNTLSATIPEAIFKPRRSLLQRLKNTIKPKDDKAFDVENQNVKTCDDYGYKENVTIRKPSMSTHHQEHLLEETSIADFIRALSAITVPEANANDVDSSKNNKIDVASPRKTFDRSRRGSLFPTKPVSVPICRRFSLRPVEEFNPISHPVAQSTVSDNKSSAKPQSQGRRFSVRPVTISSNINSPVQKQVLKKEKDDDVSK